jgi:ATP/maltotriose-dependent transcriptional regulator MalT
LASSSLATKLYIPSLRTKIVLRPHLIERLNEGLEGKLTLISAPAGFSKTTLLASYLADCGMPKAWLSLEKNDNLSGSFLCYLVTALQVANYEIGDEAAQLLAAAETAPPEIILTSLINNLDTAGRDIALVLDDYQFINNKAVHEAMTFLLELSWLLIISAIFSLASKLYPLDQGCSLLFLANLKAGSLLYPSSPYEVTQFPSTSSTPSFIN